MSHVAVIDSVISFEQDACLKPYAERGLTGNGCGHDPLRPRFFKPAPHHARRPDVIQWAIANLKQFYVEPQRWLRSLHVSRSSRRQERSEGRERDADVLGVLLHYTELASLRVGVPQNDGRFISLDMKFIAKKLGWRTAHDDRIDAKQIDQGRAPPLRGVKRVWRSLTTLKRAGYVTIHSRCEKRLESEAVRYSGLPAVRCIQPKLFWELGISGTKLRAKREQAAKRLKKAYRRHLARLETELKQGAQGVVQTVFQFAHALKKRKAIAQRSPGRYSAETRITREKVRQQRCFELKQLPENHDLSTCAFYRKYPALQPPQWNPRE